MRLLYFNCRQSAVVPFGDFLEPPRACADGLDYSAHRFMKLLLGILIGWIANIVTNVIADVIANKITGPQK